LQRQYFQEQERLGKLTIKPPPSPAPMVSLREKHGLPPHLQGVLSDAEAAMVLNFSRQLWGNAVPGARAARMPGAVKVRWCYLVLPSHSTAQRQ
jgi:hypothetical protein